MVAPGISGSLTVIFNACLKEGCNPQEWKSAIITLVHKGGNDNVTSNYRPVSMLPVVVKVLERLIHHQLYDYLQENKILDPAQFGFQPRHSTQDALVNLVEDWRDALDKDMLVGSVFIDLSKAFDMVNHRITLRKLVKYGIQGGELEWFRNYVSCRKKGYAWMGQGVIGQR